VFKETGEKDDDGRGIVVILYRF